MSLQFIMGPSGAGKSHYLHQWVTKESLENPKKKYIVLVPEQFTMQTQKDLVMASPRQGILNVEVLSFNRLAQRVFEEIGENYRTVLNDVGKNFVLRKIANDHDEELKVIGSNLKRVGYISEVKSIISEFTQYNIKPNDLEMVLNSGTLSSELCYKLSDIKIIYENFHEYLQEKYITGEEVLDVLASVAHRSRLLKDSVIVLDEFTGFTPIQNKLLSTLMKLCEDVLVTVSMDRTEDPFVYHHPYQLFALSKQMISTLVALAKEQGVEVKNSICLYQQPAYRFRENKALAFLETHLFHYSNQTFAEEPDAIQIWHAKNPMEEVDFVAQKIRGLVRTGEYRYQDIAIFTSGLDEYANQIERSFSRYQIPLFMDHKRSILLNSCVEYLRSLLAMAEQDFSYDSVFRYLRTGFSGVEQEEVDILENYVLALGIRGYKKWQERWARRSRGMSLEALEEINSIREKVVASVESVMPVLKSRSKTVREVTEAIHSFFLQHELQRKVQVYQTRFEETGELALAKEYAQVYRIIIELFEQFVELLGEEKISLKEYCELLDAGLEEAKVGVIPPSLDQVVVGDVERSRIKDVKAVFLIGASDKFLPSVSGKKGILSERDRERISEQGRILAPGEKEKIYIQKFYLYLMLTKPEKQLYVTFSTTQKNGSSARQSYLVSELMKLFPKLKIQKIKKEIRGQEFTDAKAMSMLIEGLQQRQHGLSPEWQELYTWYKKQEAWADRLENLLEAAFYQKPDNSLSRETAKQLYGDVLENSVTRLETYSACAYSHFLSYGLKLREREEFEFQKLDFGNLFHGAMEKFSNKIENSEWTWTTIPKEVAERFVQESVDEIVVDYGNSILYSSFRTEYMILRVKRLLWRSVWALKQQLERGDFIPEGYEVSFGSLSGLKMSNVDLGELGKLRLRGKIDRIDVYKTNERVYVKIVDYKSSAVDLDWSKLCHGLQLQLFVYLNAAMEMEKRKNPEKEVVPAGVFYSAAIDPIIDKEKNASIDDALLESLIPRGFIQNKKEVLDSLDKTGVQKSQVAPMKRDANGDAKASEQMLSEEEFKLVSTFVEHQVQKIGKSILEGNAEIAPHQLDKDTGCKFCKYQDICGIHEEAFGHQYRELEKMKKDEALQVMREEVETWE